MTEDARVLSPAATEKIPIRAVSSAGNDALFLGAGEGQDKQDKQDNDEPRSTTMKVQTNVKAGGGRIWAG
jgi:hypothetical protein